MPRFVRIKIIQLCYAMRFYGRVLNNEMIMKNILLSYFLLIFCQIAQAQTKFKVLALAENGGHHIQYSTRAKVWLNQLAADSSFSIDYIQNTDAIDEAYLNQYQLFIQLDYPPYGWKEKAAQAFIKYIEQGKVGWIGFHHAT